MEDHLRAGHHRSAGPRQGYRGAGAGDAERQVAGWRLPGRGPRQFARRERLQPVSHHGRDFDGVGNGGSWRDRSRAASDAWRGCKVWTPMNDIQNQIVTQASRIVIEARELTKRYGKAN